MMNLGYIILIVISSLLFLVILILTYLYFSVKSPLQGLSLDVSNLPERPNLQEISNISDYEIKKYKGKHGLVSFVESKNLEVVTKIMLHQTLYGKTIDDIEMRNKIGGIFWMDGNKAPETLASFNYSKYDKNNRLIVTPIYQKCHWAWPLNAKWGYKDLYSSFDPNDIDSQRLCSSIHFSPSFKTFDIWLHNNYLDLGKLFTVACIQVNRIVQYPSIFIESLGDGIDINRKSIWFRFFEFGTYTARQIVDNDGNHIQPAYDECKQYLIDNDLSLQLFLDIA